jgi:hypothetical protein
MNPNPWILNPITYPHLARASAGSASRRSKKVRCCWYLLLTSPTSSLFLFSQPRFILLVVYNLALTALSSLSFILYSLNRWAPMGLHQKWIWGWVETPWPRHGWEFHKCRGLARALAEWHPGCQALSVACRIASQPSALTPGISLSKGPCEAAASVKFFDPTSNPFLMQPHRGSSVQGIKDKAQRRKSSESQIISNYYE